MTSHLSVFGFNVMCGWLWAGGGTGWLWRAHVTVLLQWKGGVAVGGRGLWDMQFVGRAEHFGLVYCQDLILWDESCRHTPQAEHAVRRGLAVFNMLLGAWLHSTCCHLISFFKDPKQTSIMGPIARDGIQTTLKAVFQSIFGLVCQKSMSKSCKNSHKCCRFVFGSLCM